ncbi:lipoprotein insertase outer membrane protein LolB [Candidatus Vallotia cooleyia]|uniref:lipoprotein insertase outer membrane protein LolB n=1 Tax=Candidatus Vallotiella adelgis TaxID=1177211 RepID=UPI001D011434|nr:lipoprotein insertase outer membrane protein LolB [Candidatus Vallotia cooleyia]UDG82525.1 Outer-membrane lipoprotein LolB [Candidatus Vallotia cooleyia]
MNRAILLSGIRVRSIHCVLRSAIDGLSQSYAIARWCSVIGMATLLASCTAPQRYTAPAASRANGEQIRHAVHARHGRFAVSYEDHNGWPRNVYGNFDWQEVNQTVTLKLLNPFEQTLAIIISAPGLATLELPNKRPQIALSVSELMQATLGFSVPIEGLRYWFQTSMPPDSHTLISTDETTLLSRLKQDGWTIEYVTYDDTPSVHGKRINLTRQVPPTLIKLVLE